MFSQYIAYGSVPSSSDIPATEHIQELGQSDHYSLCYSCPSESHDFSEEIILCKYIKKAGT
jgi:hypothetical protein